MSKKIKGAKSTVKLNIKKVDAPQLITVSFCYLSKNKTRNFGFFGSKNIRQKADAFEQMLSFLQRLTLKTRADIAEIAKDRDCGFEMLDNEIVNCTPNGYQFSENDKVTVFRFGDNGNGGNYRLLGFFENNSPVLYIIGFDFDYSAYQHD